MDDFIEDAWLRSVCDDEQDRIDGFGMSVWGIWKGVLILS
jgi:CRISPR-associated protein Cmr3